MRAVVKASFAYPRGGTALALEALEGVVRPGQTIRLTTAARTVEVVIRDIGFIDHDIGRPTFHADVFVWVDGLEPHEVTPGTGISSVP